MPSHTTTRYTLTAMALHWLLALGLIGLLVFGWYMVGLPFSPTKLKYYNWHKWAGMTILALSALRLLWRITHRPPALPARITSLMPRWQQVAHHGVHHLMYVLFFAVPTARPQVFRSCGLAYGSCLIWWPPALSWPKPSSHGT